VNGLPAQLRRLYRALGDDASHNYLIRAADEIEQLTETNIKLAEHVDELEHLLGLEDVSP
jgi:hypothetical protein